MPFSTRGRLFYLDASQRRRLTGRAGLRLQEIFEASKQGDFSAASLFPSVFAADPTLGVVIGALEILPYVAPSNVLLEIADPICQLLRPDSQSIEWLCIALAKSGVLAAADKAMEIYETEVKVGEDTDLPYNLSIVLENAPGDVFYGPLVVSEPVDEYVPYQAELDVKGYALTVREKIVDIRGKFPGHSKLCFLYGEPVNIEKLALKILTDISTVHDNEDIVVGRSILEAFTGSDLSTFYRNGQLDRISAALALETLFDEVDLLSFRQGHRYFFGRKVPA